MPPTGTTVDTSPALPIPEIDLTPEEQPAAHAAATIDSASHEEDKPVWESATDEPKEGPVLENQDSPDVAPELTTINEAQPTSEVSVSNEAVLPEAQSAEQEPLTQNTEIEPVAPSVEQQLPVRADTTHEHDETPLEATILTTTKEEIMMETDPVTETTPAADEPTIFVETVKETEIGKAGVLDTESKSSLFTLPRLRRLLSVGEEAWEDDRDDMPLRFDPQVDLFLFFAKISCMVFLFGTILSTAWLALPYGLDNYLQVLTFSTDPAKCRDITTDVNKCNDNPLCTWDGVSCQPTQRNGLFDLSLQNVTPTSPRLWAVGFLAFLFSLLCFYIMYHALLSVTAYHKRIMKRQLQSALGYRTVIVKGLAVPSKEVMAEHTRTEEITIYKANPDGLSSPSEEKTMVAVNASSIQGYTGSDAEKFLNDFITAERYCQSLFEGNSDVSSKVEDVIIEREAHEKFYKTYNEYETAKVALQDAVADERRYHADIVAQRKVAYELLDKGTVKDSKGAQVKYVKETILPPLTGRIAPKLWSAVPLVEYRKRDLIVKGELLNTAILEGRSMPFTGSVFVIFKDSLAAFEFADIFNYRFGGPYSVMSAHIAGPYDKIEVVNLAKAKHLGSILMVLMILLFAVLVFFWSVPVGFLGSMDSLASVPGIGPAFQSLIRVIPTTIVGILTAYLPVIVLAIFNIVLPKLIRFFVVSSGYLTQLETDHGVMLEMYLFLVLTGVVFQAALQGGLGQLGTLIADPSQDAVFAFITAIISPKGGYWYATIIGAGCLSMWIGALLIGPLIVMLVLSQRATTQRGYDAMFARQGLDWPMKYAFTLVISSIGFFFHVTVPLLGIFTGVYFLNQYLVHRGLLLDNWGGPALVPDETITNFGFTSCAFRIMSVCYLIATVGAAIVVGFKDTLAFGGFIFCLLAVVVSVSMLVATFYYSSKWVPNLSNVRAALAAKGSENEQQRNATTNADGSSTANGQPTTYVAVPIPQPGTETRFSNVRQSSATATESNTHGNEDSTLDDEDQDASPLAVAVRSRKPYRSIHAAATEVVNAEDAIKVAEAKKYGVVMVWHTDTQRREIAAGHAKDNEKAGEKLAAEIAAGKHKPVAKPPVSEVQPLLSNHN